jgi:Holliday junction resolvasome RuvABC ATP-dependent DNA helicase subunit
VGALQNPAPPRVRFAGFIGQQALKTSLGTLVDRAWAIRQPLPHLLFCGPPKCGKSELALALAKELAISMQVADAGALNDPKDLMPFLTNVEDGSILCIRNVEKLPPLVTELLRPAIEEFQIDIVLGQGINARTLAMNLKRFTLVGTTSKPSRVARAIVDAGLLVYDFRPYDPGELLEICMRTAFTAGLPITLEATELVLRCSGGSLGSAVVMMKRLRNYLGQLGTAIDPQTITSTDLLPLLPVLGYSGDTVPSTDLADRLRAMSGTAFEEYVAEAFRRLDYNVERTGSTGDHGIDLRMRKDGQLSIVQCKRWDASVGEPVVREFFGALVSSGAHFGFLVTAGQFTRQATEFAEGKPLRLIDIDGLMQMTKAKGVRTDLEGAQGDG